MTDKRTPADRGLERRWKSFDWAFAERTLARFQREIAVAAFSEDREAIISAQKRLVRSAEAKALAVRHVCDAVSQAGVDGVKWVSGADKMRAALSLDSKGYQAKPTRMVVVRQKGKTKDRHVQMPTYFDRAMQVLYAYALDPVSESTADRRSFAFRRGRSQFDVHAYIMRAYESNPNPPLYIVKTDAKAFYATICHDWLLNNIPIDAKVLKQFLKAGHILNGELFPSDDFGISLGSSLSPILGNMTLDGAQRAVQNALHGGDAYIDYADGDMIRYADDLLFTARTRESAEAIIEILNTFLAVRGLALSEHKTHIIKATDGFDFLSRHYRLYEGFMHSEPTEAAVAKMENSMRDLITPYRGGQKTLIIKLNKKLTGWATYHKITNATQAFRRIDNVVKTLLLELCEKLNPLMSRTRIISKYFYMDTDREYVYALENKPDVRVVRLRDTVLVKHQPVSIKRHPYLDADYYEERTDNRAIMAVTGKYKPIWIRQKGKCYYCGHRILTDERRALVLIDPTKRETPKNQAYVHEYCQLGQAEFYDTDATIDTRFDLHELLTEMSEGRQKKLQGRLFFPLTEHFRQRREAKFTLKFEEIEKIIGKPLCASARKYKNYWLGVQSDARISFSWRSNGYAISNLDLKKGRVVFERSEDMGLALKIPAVFRSGRIPPDAIAEAEIMFEHIKTKYGL